MVLSSLLFVHKKTLSKRSSTISFKNENSNSKCVHNKVDNIHQTLRIEDLVKDCELSSCNRKPRRSIRNILKLFNLKCKTLKIFEKIRKGLKNNSKNDCKYQFTTDHLNICSLEDFDQLLRKCSTEEDLLSLDSSLTNSCALVRKKLKAFPCNLSVDSDCGDLSVDWSKDSVFGPESDQEEEFFSALCTRSESVSSIYEDEYCSKGVTHTEINESTEYCFEGVKLFLAHGYKVSELLELGCSTKDLLSAGCNVKEFIQAGCSVKDLIESGCKIHELLRVLHDEGSLGPTVDVENLVWCNSKIEEMLQQDPEAVKELIRREVKGEKLYPACDVTVWFRTCRQEILEPLEGETTGTIPTWLQGALLRNGPGSLEVGNDKFQHLFDGSSLIHRFEIRNSKVTYQCKFLETNTYKKNQAAQRIIVTEFGTAGAPDPCKTIFQRFSVLFKPGEMSDNAMISIYPIDDELYAFAETSVIHRIDPETLNTLERVNISEYVNIVNHTSHPHVMKDGTVYNVGLGIKLQGPCFNIVKFPPISCSENGRRETSFDKAEIVGSVPARWKLNPSYMHTFGITENYFIIVEQPLSISFATLISQHVQNKPMAPCLKWKENEKTIIHLIDKKTGNPVKKYFTDPFFFLHIINQYEEEGYVILDICCYRDAKMLDCMYIQALKDANQNINYCEMFRGRPLRFVLPLSITSNYNTWGSNLITLAGTTSSAYVFLDKTVFVCPEMLCDIGCETPRIYYEEYIGKPYRYFYAISSDVDLENPGTLIKVDTRTKTFQTWCEDNIFPSEPIFIPSPNPQSEDDGVILSSLLWTGGFENKVGLLILDAKTWKEIGRATFITPTPVPKCLHGWFKPYNCNQF